MHIDLNGTRVYFESVGAGRPVLLLHGWGARAAAMFPILERLQADHAVYAIDFPGFGQSPPPTSAWSVGDYAALVARFLESQSVERVTIVGHSFGGRVAIKLAAEQPDLVERLVLVDSAGIRPTTTAKQTLSRSVAKAGRAFLKALPSDSLRSRVEDAARARLGSEDYQAAGPLRETFVKVVNEDLRPLLPLIKAPTLLVWGDRDESTPIEDGRVMEKEIPDAGLVVLEGAGHFSYLDRPNDFARIVRVFLTQS
jgi:pimeloyl-ACP methyl ester carboxylesterase